MVSEAKWDLRGQRIRRNNDVSEAVKPDSYDEGTKRIFQHIQCIYLEEKGYNERCRKSEQKLSRNSSRNWTYLASVWRAFKNVRARLRDMFVVISDRGHSYCAEITNLLGRGALQ